MQSTRTKYSAAVCQTEDLQGQVGLGELTSDFETEHLRESRKGSKIAVLTVPRAWLLAWLSTGSRSQVEGAPHGAWRQPRCLARPQ